MHAELQKFLITFAQTVSLNKGRAYFVGGYVRDQLRGIASKDIDIEVHGVEPKTLRLIVENHFKDVQEQGESFGVLRVFWQSSDKSEQVEIDISLPRTDSKVAPGHTGFDVRVDPFMGVEAAAQRRDFTINAMMQDVLTGKVVDPFGGKLDLEAGILRAVDVDLFSDDPLRVLRAVQFAARFELMVEEETCSLMRGMVDQLAELSIDRKRVEWQKLFLQARKPSIGLQLARDLDLFVGPLAILEKMAQTEQDPTWHPEGSVWNHTVWGCDEAALLAEREELSEEDRLTLVLGNLCHDIGKIDTTTRSGGHVHSAGHQEVGQPYIAPVLTAMGFEKFVDSSQKIMRFHHHPMWLFEHQEESTEGRLHALARQLKPLTMRMLSYATEVDLRSRGPYPADATGMRRPEIADWFREQACKQDVLDHPPGDVVRGSDLMHLGLKPGPVFGLIVRVANQLHDDLGLSRETILERMAIKKDELLELDLLSLYETLAE
ncbi:hypothetical protein COV06_03345 [Candidatus Uhrbacteria bacterium CG10_big_fil_rev_8_21_14_0_10_50_16]|uniref:HD domain-containing protein n=1 Tax=Candidatus Uhrbacteria bacterium CG10_big_fil_rev_8_21_14_0_10_50_16 TaxID=1975039 RepID=A0A2H0RM04_9BACT|nr:MAG: hypothetical protein COV06_03345 [Candidatus Uhrbacteria bacterium CG10_big_fil_rev_8_21_14_0_10_50_16]